jgi:pilus assembly protein Flp/PilA
MAKRARGFLADERGATAIEYALIAAIISVAVIASSKSIGTSLSGTFSTVASNVTK